MKLLLDEMWPPAIAEQLRRRGHDVIAVAERPDLTGESDAFIFAAATRGGRAVVTENVGDFRRLARQELDHGHSHSGLILTTNRHFPRHDERTFGRLITALDELLCSGIEGTNLEHWLS